MAFHSEGVGKGRTPAGNREVKQQRVLSGRTHSALVLDGDHCVGWCQFGSVDELPRIKARRAYEASLVALPDWRVTCFFVDRGRRGEGVARTALTGALEQISGLGGGVIEGYPEDVSNRVTSGSFLFSGTTSMFEAAGFARSRQIGKHRWVMTRELPRQGRLVDDVGERHE